MLYIQSYIFIVIYSCYIFSYKFSYIFMLYIHSYIFIVIYSLLYIHDIYS